MFCIVSWGYGCCPCMSDGIPDCMAGDDEAEAILGPTDDRDADFCRVSIGGCWSTGKKLHSFLSRMQFMQRPWTSLCDGTHLIFRRRQWPMRILSPRALQKGTDHLAYSWWIGTYRMQRTSDDSPTCFFFSPPRDLGPVRPTAAELEVGAPEIGAARRPASRWTVSTSSTWRRSPNAPSTGRPSPGRVSLPFRKLCAMVRSN